MMAPFVYVLCALTSGACMVLLAAQYRRKRSRLLFWSALCFVGLAVNNLLLFLDLVIFPTEIDLQLLRLVASAAALGVLLFGFIWETRP
jgi:predicted transcriptional regulator